jgi:hypothetical protein
VRTADDDSGPVQYEPFKLPRAVLNWNTPFPRAVAGHGQRGEFDADRTPVSHRDPLADSRTEPGASTDEFDDEPTTAIPVPMLLPRPILPRTRERPDAPQVLRGRGAVHLDAALARAAQLWRDRPLLTAAMIAGVALIAYLAVDGARQRASSGSQTLLAPAPALPAAAPIIVEQLNEARQPRETGAAPLRGEQSDKRGRRSAGRRAHETSFVATPASKSSGYQAIAPAPSKSTSRQAERSSTSVASSSAGLPAWGAEAVRDFSGGTRAREQPKPAPIVTAKPAEPPAPAVAAKPAEPPAPAAPPRPSKPLTMDEMLNQVEEAAQAQRKRAGLKAPKTSQRDAELDELISGAMQSKKK